MVHWFTNDHMTKQESCEAVDEKAQEFFGERVKGADLPERFYNLIVWEANIKHKVGVICRLKRVDSEDGEKHFKQEKQALAKIRKYLEWRGVSLPAKEASINMTEQMQAWLNTTRIAKECLATDEEKKRLAFIHEMDLTPESRQEEANLQGDDEPLPSTGTKRTVRSTGGGGGGGGVAPPSKKSKKSNKKTKEELAEERKKKEEEVRDKALQGKPCLDSNGKWVKPSGEFITFAANLHMDIKNMTESAWDVHNIMTPAFSKTFLDDAHEQRAFKCVACLAFGTTREDREDSTRLDSYLVRWLVGHYRAMFAELLISFYQLVTGECKSDHKKADCDKHVEKFIKKLPLSRRGHLQHLVDATRLQDATWKKREAAAKSRAKAAAAAADGKNTAKNKAVPAKEVEDDSSTESEDDDDSSTESEDDSSTESEDDSSVDSSARTKQLEDDGSMDQSKPSLPLQDDTSVPAQPEVEYTIEEMTAGLEYTIEEETTIQEAANVMVLLSTN